jgi:hypothetical protein
VYRRVSANRLQAGLQRKLQSSKVILSGYPGKLQYPFSRRDTESCRNKVYLELNYGKSKVEEKERISKKNRILRIGKVKTWKPGTINTFNL